MKKPIGYELSYQTIQESWESFCAEILFDASVDKQMAMRSAFFAGAATSYLLFIKALQAPNKSKSKALAQALFEELDDFMMEEVLWTRMRTEGNA